MTAKVLRNIDKKRMLEDRRSRAQRRQRLAPGIPSHARSKLSHVVGCGRMWNLKKRKVKVGKEGRREKGKRAETSSTRICMNRLDRKVFEAVVRILR